MKASITIGVLAIQGAFYEHLKLLKKASEYVAPDNDRAWEFVEIRTPQDLAQCDALIIPGGESTTVSLVAARSGLLEPLRDFVKYTSKSPILFSSSLTLDSFRVRRKPTWGTCAGLILLAESANRTKKGGQDLIGGLDVRVNRNYFGRQTESFEADLTLPFLEEEDVVGTGRPFNGIFIRAPVVEKLLPVIEGEQKRESFMNETVVAPARTAEGTIAEQQVLRSVEIMATLPGRSRTLREKLASVGLEEEVGDIVAVKQGNVFGTSFHPELTEDPRIHVWWLCQVRDTIKLS